VTAVPDVYAMRALHRGSSFRMGDELLVAVDEPKDFGHDACFAVDTDRGQRWIQWDARCYLGHDGAWNVDKPCWSQQASGD